MSTNEQFYLPFGKELAANEKKNRDKAVRALKDFLEANSSSLTEKDLLKLWKGLFYCFWMSDKPLVQQALANELAALQLIVDPAQFIPFIRTFWRVHCAEWHGLDRIRTDKYLLLFRRQIYYSFVWLAQQNWDQELVEAYTTCLLEEPLHPKDRSKPDGIKFHILDLYLDELNKVIEQQQEELDDDDELAVPMGQLTRPLYVLSTDDMNKITRKKCKQLVRDYEQQMEEQDDDEDDE